ncbi:MAG: LysR family transcriptional regulator [Gammaproteobacteria bacterium]|nr:LysR family transcriptional regulator [Gammaproteobacteria bacterium]
MQLTLTGQALHQHARDILRRVELVNADLDQVGQPHIPLLRIALLPSLATLLTPVLIETATTLYQAPRISLFADLSNAHQQLIKSRQVDLLVTSQAFYDLDGLARHPLLDEAFLLVLPPGHDQFDGDLERLARHLPMVRFSPSTPVGLLVDQHLRRCSIHIERCIDADRTTMIMSTVAAGRGFCILTPTLLLDGIIEGMSLSIRELPIKPLRRSVMLVNRENELNDLPFPLCRAITTRLQESIKLLDDTARQAITFVDSDSA